MPENQTATTPQLATNTAQPPIAKRYLARALVIDDSRIDCAFLSEMLESFGCRVDVSSNGYDAVEKLDKRYDLIFLDINMPGINGLELASGLRSFKQSKQYMPIFLVSGEFFTRSLEEKCMQLGVEGYIQKPVRKVEIEELLKAYLTQHEIRVFSYNATSRNSRGFIKLHPRPA